MGKSTKKFKKLRRTQIGFALAFVLFASGACRPQLNTELTGMLEQVEAEELAKIQAENASPKPEESPSPSPSPELTETVTAVKVLSSLSLSVQTPYSQSIVANGTSTTVLTVQASDANNDAVAGETLTLIIPSNGGSVATATQTTNASGVASWEITSSTEVGSYAYFVKNASETIQSASVSLDFTLGPIHFISLAVASGSNDSILANGSSTTQLEATVKDAQNRVLLGKLIVLSIPSNGGTVASSIATTNASGIASWTLTSTTVAGSYSFTASGSGSSGTVTSSALAITFTPGAISSIALSIQTPYTNSIAATGGTSTVLSAIAKDANNNLIGNTSLTLNIPSSGGSVTSTSSTTGTTGAALGVATWTLTSSTVAGSYSYTVAANGVTSNSTGVTFTAGALSSITLSVKSGSASTLQPNGVASTILQALAKDANNNLKSGESITLVIPTNGGTTATNPVTTNASGIAEFTLVSSTTNGVYSITARNTDSSITSSGVNITFDQTIATLSIGIKSGSSTSLTPNGTDTTIIQVTARDSESNTVSGKSISLALSSANAGSLSAASATTNGSGVAEFTWTSGSTQGLFSATATHGSISSSALDLEITLCGGAFLTNAPFADGDGSTATPYLICTPAQLQAINSDSTYLTKEFKLGKNIDLQGVTWVPIAPLTTPVFTGKLFGQNFKITNFSYTRLAGHTGGGGLFGRISGAVIQDLVLETGTINCSTYTNCGALVGYATYANAATTFLSNITVKLGGNLSGATNIGGVVGYVTTTGSQWSNITVSNVGSVSITATSNSVGGVAGIIERGTNGTVILNALNVTLPTISGVGQVGGIIGRVSGTSAVNGLQLNNSFANVSQITASTSYGGGAVGYSAMTTFSKVGTLGSLSGGSYLGGVVGYTSGGSISESYSQVNVTSTAIYSGGIVGQSASATTIADCYSSGSISSSSTHVGGIAGFANASITRVYAVGSISGSAPTGGLVGQLSSTTLSGAFWNATTTGQANPVGSSTSSTILTLNLSNEAFKMRGYFLGSGFDWVTKWTHRANTTTYPHPVLRWQSQAAPDPTLAELLPNGTGSAGDPYLISTADDLYKMELALELYSAPRSAVFKLAENIDLSTKLISPSIGSSSKPFIGELDGNSKTISGVTWVGSTSTRPMGIFSYIATPANIHHVNVSGVVSSSVLPISQPQVGTLVGQAQCNSTTLCQVKNNSVTITGNGGHSTNIEKFGGLIGSVTGGTTTTSYFEITNNTVNFQGTVSTYKVAGGLIGTVSTSYIGVSNEAIIQNNTVSGTGGINTSFSTFGGVSGNGSGGLIGDFYQNSMSQGTIRVKSNTVSLSSIYGAINAGGLIGTLHGGSGTSNVYVQENKNSGAVSGVKGIGGLVGYWSTGYTYIEKNINTGNISGAEHVGGIVGHSLGTNGQIKWCYNRGNVEANGGTRAGGVFGYVGTASSGNPAMQWLFSTGSLTGTSTSLGGVAGFVETNYTHNIQAIWNKDNAPTEAGYPSTKGWLIGATTAHMKSKTFWINRGMSFSATYFALNDGVDFPKLQWESDAPAVPTSASLLSANAGTVGDPHLISSAADFANMHMALHIDTTKISSHFKLTQNIDLSTLAETPQFSNAFTGNFNGQGFNIQNIAFNSYVTENITSASGLFRGLSTGVISNLQLTSGGYTVHAANNAGVLVGSFSGAGNISNVQLNLTGAIICTLANSGCGGIVGSVSNSSAVLSGITVTGGGSISHSGSFPTGGIAGTFTSTGANTGLANTGISVTSGTNAGGLFGSMSGNLTQSYVSGVTVQATAGIAGGVFGSIGVSGTSSKIYSLNTTVKGTTYVGGIVGSSQSTLEDCYVQGGSITHYSGTVTGGGGIVGHNATGGGVVRKCYSTASVGGTGTWGGAIGVHGSATANYVLWDTETSGQNASAGGALVIGVNTANAKTAATYVNNTFDFSTIWIQDGVNTYPILRFQSGAPASHTLANYFASGDGSSSTPFQVSTSAQLQAFGFLTQVESSARSLHYTLTQNIDMNGNSFGMVGGSSSATAFTGNFNGGGYTVSNVSHANIGGSGNRGFFQSTGSGANISNLNISYSSFGGANNSGGLVGYAYGPLTINNVNVSINGVTGLTSRSYIGGLIGYLNTTEDLLTTISNSTCEWNTSLTTSGHYVGGCIGMMTTKYLNIENLQSGGTGSLTGLNYVGGLVGYSTQSGSVSRSFTKLKSSLNVNGNSYIAGIMGRFDSSGITYNTLSDAVFTGNVVAPSSTTGRNAGLIGYTGGISVSNCAVRGNVTSSGSSEMAGIIPNGSSSTVRISACYFSGILSGTTTSAYPFASAGFGPFDKTKSSSYSSIQGGMSTSEMQDRQTYVNLGFDFINKWTMPTGGGYPLLQWESGGDAPPTLASVLPSGGDGTAGSPYQITTEAELKNLSLALAGNSTARSAYYLLVNDITLTDNIVPPVLTGLSTAPFTGNFDGNNKKIIYGNHSFGYLESGGLFGYVGVGGNIRNLTVQIASGKTVTTTALTNRFGLMIGSHSGDSTNVTSGLTATIDGTLTTGTGSYHGGLIGYIEPSNSESANSVRTFTQLTANGSGIINFGATQAAGGVIGYITNPSTVTGTNPEVNLSYLALTGSITINSSSASAYGGLIGQTTTGAINRYIYLSRSKVEGSGGVVTLNYTGSGYGGGLVGNWKAQHSNSNYGRIENSYSIFTGTINYLAIFGGVVGTSQSNGGQFDYLYSAVSLSAVGGTTNFVRCLFGGGMATTTTYNNLLFDSTVCTRGSVQGTSSTTTAMTTTDTTPANSIIDVFANRNYSTAIWNLTPGGYPTLY